MVYDVRLSTLEDRIQIVKKFIENKKTLNANYSIIDVGGTMNGWTHSFVNAIIDLNKPTNNKGIMQFSFNINYPNDWKLVEEYVNINGKFDFSICSHTLEDISSPKFVCDQLTKISKSGYIAIPSKYNEFSKFVTTPEGKKIRGNVHHRWIFTFKDNKFLGFPKIPYIEIDDIFNKLEIGDKKYENLGFFWENCVELNIINNDYLGSTQHGAMNTYRTELFNDDIDKKYSISYK